MNCRTLSRLMLVVALCFVASRVSAAEEDEVKMKLAACPAAVQKTLKREAGGAKISEVDKELEDGKTIYEVDVKIDGKNYEVTVAEDGTLLEKVLDEDGKEEQEDRAAEQVEEEKIKLSDCPVAVQKTLKREATGEAIETVDKETDDGKTVYEVDVKIGGRNYEIKVAPDGTLISKSLDEEDEEEDK